jgi:hypothetical protein
MEFDCIASVLNLRAQPSGSIVGEIRLGDKMEVEAPEKEWVAVEVKTGASSGQSGFVRRKWIIQAFDSVPELSAQDRGLAASIIAGRTEEFDAVHYDLGTKAESWEELGVRRHVDCSGWVYLLAKEIMSEYDLATKPGMLYTFSDHQITRAGAATGAIISGEYISADHFVPGVVVGIDFGVHSWDRGRPLDIDHIAIVGANKYGRYISQSSSTGGGVNVVPLDKWVASQASRIKSGRVHLVDLLSLP